MVRQQLLEIKFKGRGLRPDKIFARDLAEIIRAAEGAVLAYVRDDGERGILRVNAGLSLVEIKASSLALRFSQHVSEAVGPAFEALAQDINAGGVDSLPVKARNNISSIQDFCTVHSCRSEFRNRPSAKKPLAVLLPVKRFSPVRPHIISGNTTIYGVLEGIGGVSPKAKVRVHGVQLDFTITEDQARDLGPRLYTTVGLQGDATWDADTGAIVTFRFDGLTPYSELSPVQCFEELRQQFGHYFDAIPDVDAFLREVREA